MANESTKTTPWMTTDDAAAYLGYRTIKALYSAVERGHVPVHRLRGRLRFRRDELDSVVLASGPRVPSPGKATT